MIPKIAIVFFSLIAVARGQNLLVDYPIPSIKRIDLLPQGSTQQALGGYEFANRGVDIRVRLFPIMSAPFRDPYPVVRNPFLVELFNKSGLLIVGKENGSQIVQSPKIKFDFLANQIIAENNIYPLVESFVSPLNPSDLTDATWDVGQKDDSGQLTEVSVKVRGDFWIAKTTFLNLAPRLQKILDQNHLPHELWSVLNRLTLNQYLQSVLPSEISAKWPSEAIKTQAIAARTYALFEMALARNRDKKIWDVDPTTWYQSYRGVNFRRGAKSIAVEFENTNKAVKDSRHNIITYNGEVIQAFFSSNSGGVTCSAKECFNLEGDNPPYLVSVPDAPGIEKLPFGTWGEVANVTPATIKNRLLLMGYPHEIDVKELLVGANGESGRVWGLRVILKDDNEIKLNRMQSSAMMTLFGPVRSYLYNLFPPDSTGRQKVVGHGLGHGVGMSQYGSYLFAQQGWTAEKILAHYYQKTVLFQIAEENAD